MNGKLGSGLEGRKGARLLNSGKGPEARERVLAHVGSASPARGADQCMQGAGPKGIGGGPVDQILRHGRRLTTLSSHLSTSSGLPAAARAATGAEGWCAGVQA